MRKLKGSVRRMLAEGSGITFVNENTKPASESVTKANAVSTSALPVGTNKLTLGNNLQPSSATNVKPDVNNVSSGNMPSAHLKKPLFNKQLEKKPKKVRIVL